jgi:predicted MFS family arabinose efflux permease
VTRGNPVRARLTSVTPLLAAFAILALNVGTRSPATATDSGRIAKAARTAGANLGTFAGAAIGGAALSAGGYGGLAPGLAGLAAATLAATAWALRKVEASADADRQGSR